MPKKLENMSDEEFSAHIKTLDDDTFMQVWTEFGDKVALDRQRLLEFSKQHQYRTRVAELKTMRLTPGDLELLQSLEPETIESAEEVGEQSDEETE